MGRLSPGGIIGTAFLLVFFIVALSFNFGYFTSPAFSNGINSTANQINSSLSRNFYNPINIASTSNNTGFNSQILAFTGLAFVFNGIGTVMNSLLNMPRLIILSVAITLSVFNIPLSIAVIAPGLLIIFLLSFILFAGIGWWMKAETWYK